MGPQHAAELRRKVPGGLLTAVEHHRLIILSGFAFAACSLHGPFIGTSDHNGLRYLIGPWLCPALVATYYYLRPFRPYKSGAARYAGLVDYDSEDVDARRLSTIFASNEARRFLLRATAKLSGQL